MRFISFMLTVEQFRDGSKTVTRRIGWENLRPGDRLMAVVKGMGLKKGEKVERLGEIEVVSAHREQLHLINLSPSDVAREGFPEMTAPQFITMFCKHMKCDSSTVVTRIEFKRIEGGRA